MMKFLVSVNGAPAKELFIQPRTPRLLSGVLCEVAIDGRFQLCLLDRVGTVMLEVRPLPDPAEAPRDISSTRASSASGFARRSA